MDKDSFKEDIEDFIELRINQCYNILSKNKDYKKVSRKYDELFEQIQKVVNNETTTSDYLKSQLDMYGFQNVETYKTGFLDGINIAFKCADRI